MIKKATQAGSGTTFTGGSVTSTVYANGDNTLDLGTTTARWRAGYFVTLKDGAGVTRFNMPATSTTTLMGAFADGATAVNVVVDTQAAYANAAAKLLSVRNNGTAKFEIDKDGNLTPGTTENGTVGTFTKQFLYVYSTGVLTRNIVDNNGVNRVAMVTGATLGLTGTMVDGASAVGTSVNTAVAYANAGSKLFSVRNNAVEKAFVDKDGHYEVVGASGSIVLASPDGTRYRLTIANGGTVAIAAA